MRRVEIPFGFEGDTMNITTAMLVEELRKEAPNQDHAEWLLESHEVLMTVPTLELLPALDHTFREFASERRAIEVLLEFARINRPDLLPICLFRVVEMTKELTADYELPAFMQCITRYLPDLSSGMRHALLVDLLVFLRRMSAHQMWWYALAYRDVVKLLLGHPDGRAPDGRYLRIHLAEEACTTIPWDIPYLDLLIHLGYRQRSPQLWIDACDPLFHVLPGGTATLSETMHVLQPVPMRVPKPTLPSFTELNIADSREDFTRAALALRVVTHMAVQEDATSVLAAEKLAAPVFAFLAKEGSPTLGDRWAQLTPDGKRALGTALEACDPRAAAEALGEPEQEAFLKPITAAGYTGWGTLPSG